MSDREQHVAAFVSSLTSSAIPDAVTDHARLVVADTLGAVLGGGSDAAVSGLVSALGDEGGDARIPGTDRRASVPNAALIAGTAGTTLELDEGHKYAAGHPAIHVLPVLLADGEARAVDRATFLTAFVAGYEAAVRVARACTPLASGYHPHGVWGSVGAAAGLARLRGFDAETTLAAMRIAANHAQHTRFEAATEGATVRNTYAGMSGVTGYLSAIQATAGVTATDRGIGRHLGRVAADGFDADRLDDGLGTTWEVTRGYFKRHAACRYIHPALDAVASLGFDDPTDPAAIARIAVETYPAAATLDDPRPDTPLAARFSLPYAVAAHLVYGRADKAAFEPEAIGESVYRLAERVELSAPTAFAERVPEARSARVTVEFVDGSARTEHVEHARGGSERPFTEAELESKFHGLVEPVLGDDGAADLWRAAREGADPTTLAARTVP
ncbi:MmgE/PrpD family protein [Haloferacaceae archaeon DSL9]